MKTKKEIEDFILNYIENGKIATITPTKSGGVIQLKHSNYSLKFFDELARFVNAKNIDFDSSGKLLNIVWW